MLSKPSGLAVLTSMVLVLGGPARALAAGDSAAAIKAELDAAVRAQSLAIDRCLEWIERAYAVADANVGSDEGFQALELVIEISGRRKSAEIERAAEGVEGRLIAGYADDAARMGPFLEESGDLAFARAVLERTKTPAVEAACLYAEIQAVIDSGYAAEIPAEESARALAIARRLQAEHGEVKNHKGLPFREAVAGDVYQLERLNIGMPAPEIEGQDLDGVPFKLSDYRGKVVVLDFWGNW
jgi:hypothetical protein